MKRRDFLFGVIGAGAVSTSRPQHVHAAEPEQEPPRIKEYRTLGRTGFKASDIGSGAPMEEGVLHALLMQGVNYIDTAESYSNGASERLVGRVIKAFDRKKLFITTKFELRAGDDRGRMKDRALRCLGRLDSDYMDCLMIHAASAREHVTNEAFHQAAAELKQEGKLRYVGVSCHGHSWYNEPKDSMEDVLGAAAEDGRFDLMLFVYNYLQKEGGDNVLRICREKNIGTTLMKTDPFGFGAFTYFNDLYAEREREGQPAPEWLRILREKYAKQRKEAAPFLEAQNLTTPDQIRDAAIRFVLDHQDVHSALISFKNYDEVDNYLRLSGNRLTETDEEILAVHAETDGQLYCRHACGVCEPHCPYRVPVNTILRYNHYYVAQGREKRALELYERLAGPRADLCDGCDAPCQKACPYSVPAGDLMKFAHSNLTLA